MAGDERASRGSADSRESRESVDDDTARLIRRPKQPDAQRTSWLQAAVVVTLIAGCGFAGYKVGVQSKMPTPPEQSVSVLTPTPISGRRQRKAAAEAEKEAKATAAAVKADEAAAAKECAAPQEQPAAGSSRLAS